MIIQCEKCQTKFRLDDSRVTDKGVKVRCTKCKYVFTVRKEASAATPDLGLVTAEEASDTPLESEAFGNSFRSEPADPGLFTAESFAAAPPSLESDPCYAAGPDDNQSAAVDPFGKRDEVGFSDFVFGDSEPEPDPPVEAVYDGADSITPALSSPDPYVNGPDSAGKSGSLFSLDAGDEVSFNPGEIDFGDDLTVAPLQQGKQDDLSPPRDIPLTPPTFAGDDFMRLFPAEDDSSGEQDLPPLSIASRRKQNPLFGALIAVVALVSVSVLGYFGYSTFIAPKEAAVAETGKISVRAVKSAFIKNDKAGELLVISGEALNEYQKSRAALQVKVTVFDAAGHSIATKCAYGGNPLTAEQAGTLPLDKIEAVMANQFGDSLANMEVASGKTIPFVVVLANIPKEARDFAVQPAGSTVATGKQQ